MRDLSPPRREPGRPPHETRPPIVARGPAPPRSEAAVVARWMAGAVLRNPAAALACAAAAAMAGAIALNAAAYQARPHPSPLFGAWRRAEAPRQEGRGAEGRRAEARPESRAEARQEPRPEARQEARQEPRHEPRHEARPAPVPRAARAPDPAPDLPQQAAPLPPARPSSRPVDGARLAEVATGSVSPSAPARPAPDPALAAAQRAFIRLGYPGLKADGLMGPLTRQAIERFEREHRLKVTGELNARTVRALQEQAQARPRQGAD